MSHRQQPVANKLCSAAWVARDVSRHRERLGLSPVRVRGHGSEQLDPLSVTAATALQQHVSGAEPISAVVDARPPRTLSLRVDRTAKRAQAADEAGAEVDRQNALLLARMSNIVLHGQGAAHAQAMGLDGIHASTAAATRKGPRTLNAGYRERELARIGADNAAILRRLSERKPVYRRDEWQRHEQRHAAYLANMRERPLPADAASPAARALIPLPRFMREQMEAGASGGGSGAVTERRPPHAYLKGQYSSTFSHTNNYNNNNGSTNDGSMSSRYQSPQQQRQYAATASGYHRSNDSQSARGTGAGGGSPNSYVLYKPPTPNRTGVSRHSSAAGAHTLEPLPPRPHMPQPRQPPPQQQQLQRPHILLLQSERAFPAAAAASSGGEEPGAAEERLVVSVFEVAGGGADDDASESTPLTSLSDVTAAGSPQMLLSAPVQEGLHSLLFRLPESVPMSAAGVEGAATANGGEEKEAERRPQPQPQPRQVQVPWRVVCALPEVVAATAGGGSSAAAAGGGGGALDPSRRAALALVLLDRLQLTGGGIGAGGGAAGRNMCFSLAKLEPQQEQRAIARLQAQTHATASAAAAAQGQPQQTAS